MAIFKIPLSFVGSEYAANFKFISVGLYQTPICAKVSEKCQIRSNPPAPYPRREAFNYKASLLG